MSAVSGTLVLGRSSVVLELGVPDPGSDQRYLLAWRDAETRNGMLRLTLQRWTERRWTDEGSAECEVPPAVWDDEAALMPLVRDLAARLQA